MKKIEQSITGNNNIQVAGDLKVEKVIHKIEVVYDEKFHITNEQAKEIQDRIKKIAFEEGGKKPNYSHSQAMFKRHFKIESYKLLPKEKYDEAIEWLNKQIAIKRDKLKKVDIEQWRKDMYKSIHARSKELNIDIHVFATDLFHLKKQLTSLKDLSDLRLKRLYNSLFSIH